MLVLNNIPSKVTLHRLNTIKIWIKCRCYCRSGVLGPRMKEHGRPGTQNRSREFCCMVRPFWFLACDFLAANEEVMGLFVDT